MRISENNLRKKIRTVISEFFLAGKKNKSLAQTMLGSVQNTRANDYSYMYDEEGMHMDDDGYYGYDDGDAGDLGESEEDLDESEEGDLGEANAKQLLSFLDEE